jgi:hypothetical protein
LAVCSSQKSIHFTECFTHKREYDTILQSILHRKKYMAGSEIRVPVVATVYFRTN